MVFARTKLLMHDTCFEERPGKVALKYVGPQPKKIYAKAYETVKTIFKASDADIQEEQFNWGKGAEDKFKIRWWLHKDLDRFSYLWIRFDVAGSGTEKQGNVSIVVTAYLRTEYPQDTVWQRSLFYEMMRTFWHRLFYHNKRMDYITECRDLVSFYSRKMREFFDDLKGEEK